MTVLETNAIFASANEKQDLVDFDNNNAYKDHPRRQRREKTVAASVSNLCGFDYNPHPDVLVANLPMEVLAGEKCLQRPFEQNVTSIDGCKGTVTNYLCVGLCTSVYVPRNEGGSSHRICNQCAPILTKKVQVKLHCPNSAPRKQIVEIIEKCACQSLN